MNHESYKILLTIFLATAASSCSQENRSISELDANGQFCNSDPNIHYICGPLNAEDLLSVGDTGMILTSGMNGTLDGSETNGHLYLLNPTDEKWADLVSAPNFSQDFAPKKEKINKDGFIFDEETKKDFLNGAKIAYETIITDFSDDDNKLIKSKPLLSNKIQDQFNDALKERSRRGHFAEITFIGVNSAEIKEHNQNNDLLEVTVNFISEIITCIKDNENKIISGDPQKIKKVNDTWKFSRNIRSQNPNWQLVETEV